MQRSQLLQLLFCSMGLTACQFLPKSMDFEQPLNFLNSEADQVTYRFTDSSVPPRYHRSYSIIVTARTVSITVDSYGDILAEQELSSSPEQFQAVLALLDEAQIRKGRKSKEMSCTGGTSDRLLTHRQGNLLFDAYAYNCGGKSASMEGDIAAVKKYLQSLIPDFASLTRT